MNLLKKVLVGMMLIFASGAMSAQENHGYNIYGQFFGSSTGVGVGIDSRFKTGGILGYSAGIGFTDMSMDNGARGFGEYIDVDSKGLSIPVEINAIMGKRASKFEVGLGFTAYLIKRKEFHEIEELIPVDGPEGYEYRYDTYRKNVFRPNILGTLNFGYRLQRKSGFFMKIGLSILIGDFKCSPVDGIIALPNICLGYTIPHF